MTHATDHVEARMMDVRDIQLAYQLRGRGDPLLLLHGFSGCGADFQHAGRDRFEAHYRLIIPDARGHGGSGNGQASIRHDECARDTLCLLDQLGFKRIKAVGISMGGNILLHMALIDPRRIEAMVLVSATPRFPEQARAIMRSLPAEPGPDDWRRMRAQHRRGDVQIAELWRAQRAFAESYDDLCFTPADLARIQARTLIHAGKNDPLYPVSLAEELARHIPRAELVLTDGGHSPVFLAESEPFVECAVSFLAAG